jgi:phosphatidylglycerophosphate synthase
VNDILLGPLERPALRWMAAHSPAWVTPDILTGLGILGGVIIAVSYVLTNLSDSFLWLASLGFVINWVGDSLDGTLARYRKIERPRYGFFVDHTVDCFVEAIIFLGLATSAYLRFDIGVLMLIGYLMMSVLVYVRMLVLGEFKISYGKLGPTEVRAIAILANTLILIIGNPVIPLTIGTTQVNLTVYDWIGIVVATLLWGIFLGSTIRQARQLSREDVARRWQAAPAEDSRPAAST